MIKIIGNQGNRTEGKIVLESFADAKKRWEKEDNDKKAITAFKSSLHTEQEHDAIMRDMYGSYGQYVAQQLEENTSLSDSAKANLISYYGITDSDTIRKNTKVKQGTAVNSSSKASAFQNLVKGVNDGTVKVAANISDEAVTQWSNSIPDVCKRAVEYLKKEGYKQPDTNLSKEIDDYLAQAADVAQYMRANKTRYQDYDKVYEGYVEATNYLRDLKRAVDSENKIFSNLKTEKDYEDWKIGWLQPDAETNEETVAARKEKYAQNKTRIEEIKKQIEVLKKDGFTSEYERGSRKTIIKYINQDEIDALKTELETLQAENTRYEREQKDLDDYYIPATDEFLANGAERNYNNASLDDLKTYSLNHSRINHLLSSGTHKWDAEGNIINIYSGNIVYAADELSRAMMSDAGDPLSGGIFDTNKSDNAIDQLYNSLVQDKLGLYLSASEDDLIDAWNVFDIAPYGYQNLWNSMLQEGAQKGWEHLTEYEINIYYNLFKTQGQSAAYKFLDDMALILSRRATAASLKSIDKATGFEQVALNIASIPMNVVGGAVAFVDDAVHILAGEDINPYSRAHFFHNSAQYIREVTANDINEATGNASLPWLGTKWGDVYQTVMSAGDSVVGLVIGGTAYGAMMGMGAASQEMKKLWEQGASTGQMLAGGLLAGAAEMVFEKFSIDKLVDMKSPASVLKNFFVQGGIEASEEMATEIANTITNAIVMGSQSDWVNAETFVKNVLNAGLSGFISGGFMGGTVSLINHTQASSIGKAIKLSGETGKMFDAAKLAFNGSKTNELYSEYVSKGVNESNITNAQLGNLYISAKTEANQILSSKKSTTEQKNTATNILGKIAEVESAVNATVQNNKSISGAPNIDGQTPTGYNNDTNINQDKGGNVNVDSIERGRLSRSNTQSEESNSGGKSQSRRTWSEDEGSFIQRATSEQSKGGRGRQVKQIGKTFFAYTLKEADGSQASIAVEMLNKAGIKAVYCDGNTESNDGKNTTTHTEAVTAPDGIIYVSSSSSLSAIHIAAHEAVHSKSISNSQEYFDYEAVVCDNILWGSDAYIDLAKRINDGHYNGTYDVNSYEFGEAFIKEITAYVNEFICADINKAAETFAPMFSNWDAVVEASRKFNEAIGLDFSSADTATESSSTNSQSTDTDSESAPTGITELSAADAKKDAFKLAMEDVTGYKELTEEQKIIRNIGHQLGWKVEFGPVRTPKGRKADGKISFATKTITIDPTSKKPIQFILKHELAHSLEQNKAAYAELQNAIMDSKVFKDYVKAQGFALVSDYNADIVARYKAEGVKGFDSTRAEYKANCEMVANFVGDCLFGGNTEVTVKLLEGMNTTQRRSFIQLIKDFFAKIRDKLSGKHKQLIDEISRLEAAFLKTLNSVETKENTATQDGEADAYSINEDFYSEFDAWDGKDTNKVFTIGTTSEALKLVNIKNQEIKMRSGMILQKLNKHPEMSKEIFRNIPDLLEQPIIVQFSDAIDPKTGKPKYDSRITVLGELYANMVVDGKTVQKPVLVSLELLPTNQKKTKILDVSFVTSAYTKEALQQYINQNSILYIEPNKKRTNKWLSLNRLSLPLGENQTGPIRKITYVDGKVKVQNSTKKTEMQLALEKAGVINSYGNSIFNDSENDTSDNESFSISESSNEYKDDSDTHYGEHIHHTPTDYKPKSDREWQVFCRSFANQTNGMKDGEYRAVSIFTADAHYLISADGYMSGVIVDKVSIDEYEERKEFYDNIPRADVSNFGNEENGRGQRNHSNSDITSQDEGTDSFDVELDAFIESHPEWFADKRKTRSNYSRSIEKSIETDESFSISEKTDIDSVLDAVSRGEMSTEEAKTLLSKTPKKAMTPYDIAHLKPRDADITAEDGTPKMQGEGNRESKLYQSLLNSEIITEDVKKEIEADTYIKNYQGTTNKRTLKIAAEELAEGGMAKVQEWHQLKAEKASAVDVAIGLILLERYQRAGRTQSAVLVAEKLREIGTSAGQTVQIFSIIGRFNPEMMQAYAQKELDMAYEALVEAKTQKWAEKHKDRFKLTEEDIEFIRRRTLQAAILEDGTRQKSILLAEICTRIQDKLPPEAGQSLRALQRISLLLNVRTNLRNIVGNANMVPVFIASDFFGSLLDKHLAKKTGVRTTGNFQIKGSGEAFKKGLAESYDDFKRGIRTKQDELNRYDVNRGGGKSFNEHHKKLKQLDAVSKALNKLDNFTSFCLEAGDRGFFEVWFQNSLNNQMRLNNVEIPTENMINIARDEAMQRTWQDNNTVTRTMTRLKNTLNKAHIPLTSYGFGDFVLKFVKTPANIGKAMVQFSPLGFTSAITKGIKFKDALETGNLTPQMQKDFVSSMSNAFVGTVIYALVALLASTGAIALTGAGDEDKDVSNFEKYIVGVPPYSMKIFGVDVTYSWNQPMGTIFATVADIMDSKKDGTNASWYEDAWNAFKAGATVFTEQSFLSSLYELFSADDITTGFAEAFLSEPSAFIPQILSQVASFTDPYRRTTYENGRPIQSAINSIIYKIPGLRQKLPAQVNVLGETVENVQYLNPWEAFANPSTTYPESSGAVAEEIYELYKVTGDKKVMPRVAPNKVTIKGINISFNAEEKADFQRSMGTCSVELLKAVFDSKGYAALSDEEKIKAVAKVYEYAYAKAKTELDIFDYELLSAMEGTKTNGDPILSKSLYNRLDAKAKQMLIDEYFFSKAEMKCKGDTEKLAELFVKQVKD